MIAITASAAPAGAQSSCDPTRIAFDTAGGVRVFDIEIADEPDEQARGLMFRRQMAEDAGMLFVYAEPQRAAFWMKNTFLPLDMIFIASDGRVESVAADTVPFSLAVQQSEGEVAGVLEVNAGLAAELGIGPGVQARHPAFRGGDGAALCAD